jgi:hypothetical protein
MNIRLSDHDVSFDDKTLRAMGKAYDHACDALGCFGIAGDSARDHREANC